MILVAETPRQRTVDALELVAEHYGVADELERVRASEDWQAETTACLAEVLAAILTELVARDRLPRGRRQAG